MTWPNFYLTCFLLGFSLSVVSFLLGSLNLHGLHLFHGHVGHAGHVGQAGHVGHAGHAGALHSAGGHAHQAATVSPFNFATISAFLAWFGGAGYLLTRYGGLVAIPALLLALLTGIAGGGLMFWFMASVLWSPSERTSRIPRFVLRGISVSLIRHSPSRDMSRVRAVSSCPM